MPVAILHMLPEHLWPQTALETAQIVTLSAAEPGLPNRRLRARPLDGWLDEQTPTGTPVPLLTLEPEFLSPWARLVAGVRSEGAPAAIFGESAPPLPAQGEKPPPLSPQERLDYFQNTASDTAFR